MLIQFTVTVDGREVGTESREVSGSAAEVEEQIREMQQRTGRMSAASTRSWNTCHRGVNTSAASASQPHSVERAIGKLPESLRRETEVIDVPESVKQATGGVWQPIGEEISEKLDYTPSSLFVRRIVRPKYVVRLPDSDRPEELRIAELPPEALPKSKAAPGLVADVIVSKLVDHLPVYRQEQRYARQGFPRP